MYEMYKIYSYAALNWVRKKVRKALVKSRISVDKENKGKFSNENRRKEKIKWHSTLCPMGIHMDAT